MLLWVFKFYFIRCLRNNFGSVITSKLYFFSISMRKNVCNFFEFVIHLCIACIFELVIWTIWEMFKFFQICEEKIICLSEILLEVWNCLSRIDRITFERYIYQYPEDLKIFCWKSDLTPHSLVYKILFGIFFFFRIIEPFSWEKILKSVSPT